MTGHRHLRICIIGAGPSGLATAKNLLQAGLSNITVFERADHAGGNWVYSSKVGHSSVYESIRTISSKTLSQYEDFPFPADFPDYPSQPQLLGYFKSYADHFGINEKIRCGTEVQHVDKLDDFRWEVRLSDGSVGEFNAIFICNG